MEKSLRYRSLLNENYKKLQEQSWIPKYNEFKRKYNNDKH